MPNTEIEELAKALGQNTVRSVPYLSVLPLHRLLSTDAYQI